MSEHPGEHSKRLSAKSGEHPAVKAYRAKLASVDKGASAAMSDLDRELQEFLDDLKKNTPIPPET